MISGRKGLTAVAGLITMLVFFAGTVEAVDLAVRGAALKSGNLASVRREALTYFPRGSRFASVADELTSMGFQCVAVPHVIRNVSSPSLNCESNGRGFPEAPRLTITVLTRNGRIADVEVWNTIDPPDGRNVPPAVLADL